MVCEGSKSGCIYHLTVHTHTRAIRTVLYLLFFRTVLYKVADASQWAI